MPELQAGRAGGQARARTLRRASPARVPALPSRGGTPARAPRGARGRSRGRSGKVLADARPSVREPAAPEAAPAPQLRRTVGARQGALRLGDEGRVVSAACARADRRRTGERGTRHPDVLRERRALRRIVRSSGVGGSCRGRARRMSTSCTDDGDGMSRLLRTPWMFYVGTLALTSVFWWSGISKLASF